MFEERRSFKPRVALATPRPTEHPHDVKTTRRWSDVLFVAGAGKTPSDVMFIQTSLQEDEAMDRERTFTGASIEDKPRYLKSGSGVILTDCARNAAIDMDDCYFTALVKWLLPKEERKKPDRDAIAMATPALLAEIKRVQPKIIVCLGKPAFDVLVDVKGSISDLQGGWFHSALVNARVYLMPDIMLPVFKPEYIERFNVDMKQVKRMWDQINGVVVDVIPSEMTFVRNTEQMENVVREWEEKKYSLFSVDCEWKGRSHVDGLLRSFQAAPTPTRAFFFQFMNERAEYVMNAPYKTCGQILGRVLNKKQTRYLGHHISADYPWMDKFLDLEWYQRTEFDTEFGQQVVDEDVGGGLEELSIRYTPFGRYDIELMLWYKANRQSEDDGFGYVPDKLIEPYGCYDVLTPYRAWPYLLRRMVAEGTAAYFMNTFLPFVSDVFTNFAIVGLPMNVQRMDELRDLFTFATQELNIRFKQRVANEARTLFLRFLQGAFGMRGLTVGLECLQLLTSPEALKHGEAERKLLDLVGPEKKDQALAFFHHMREAPGFNIRSAPMMRRWLFDVIGLTPVKSTNNKEKGLPTTSWEKVMAMTPARQKEFTPSTDKQTLQILADKHETIGELLNLNAVGNLSKAFLKEPEIDEETGEVTKENGLHFWLCSDQRVHCQYSTTDTGRPRSWKPNTLNWPSYVNKRISEGVGKLLLELKEANRLPEKFEKYLVGAMQYPKLDDRVEKVGKNIPSIRGCVDISSLPPVPGSKGWCIVEYDYDTAEIRGKAFMSGDENLIRLMTEPDTQFGLVKEGTETMPVRLRYDADCGIPEGNRNPQAIMHLMKEGKVIRKVEEHELLRKDGKLRHPKHDLHWSLAEWVQEKPREYLNKKKDRDGIGKVGNFSCLPADVGVLTNNGVKKIKEVSKDFDLLWDGVDWVRHEGLICKGEQHIIEYQGLRATVDHGVWLMDGREVFFGEAALAGLDLARTGSEAGQARLAGFATEAGAVSKQQRQSGGADILPALRGGASEMATPSGIWQRHSLCVSGAEEGRNSLSASHAVSVHEAALQHVDARQLLQLQGAGNPGAVSGQGALHLVGAQQVAGRDLQGEGFRSDRQRRPLLAGQSSPGGPSDQSREHASFDPIIWSEDASVRCGASGGEAGVQDSPQSALLRSDGGAAGGEVECRGVSHQGAATGEFGFREGGRILGGASGGGVRSGSGAQACLEGLDRSSNPGSVEEVVGESGSREHLRGGQASARCALGSLVQLSGQAPEAGKDCGGNRRNREDQGIAPERLQNSSRVHGHPPGNPVLGVACKGVVRQGNAAGGNPAAILGVNGYRGRPRDVLIAELRARGFELTLEPVYDLVNAGPRHRFTANGVLVSNTAYGAVDSTLERKIESDAGFKPPEGTGSKILGAIAKREPVATRWLEEDLQRAPEHPGFLVAQSGRRRHFAGYGMLGGSISGRDRRAQLSAMGRVARNFPCQESVAATSARAGINLVDEYRRRGMHARLMTILYDSCVSICPVEERFLVSRLHEIYMTEKNTWFDHGRVWFYPASGEFNLAWSSRPSKDQLKLLDDPTWANDPVWLKEEFRQAA